MIFELKNEPELGRDPFLKNLIAYGEIIRQKEVSFPSPPIGNPFAESPQKVFQILSTVKPACRSAVLDGGPL